MPTAAITARTVNDTIILTGSVDSAEEAQRAGDIAQGFVQRSMVISAQAPGAPGESGATGAKFNGMVVNTLTIRGRDQVMLKVTVAEIDRNIAKQLGITTSMRTRSELSHRLISPICATPKTCSICCARRGRMMGIRSLL